MVSRGREWVREITFQGVENGCIANEWVNFLNDNKHFAGIMRSDISDHFPIF